MPIYEFSENNSGGSWWLNRSQYDSLFEAGFQINEEKGQHYGKMNSLDTKDVPWAWRHCLVVQAASLQEAVETFESATGEDFFAEGCNCCGAPFSMYEVDGTDYVSGDSVQRRTIRPW